MKKLLFILACITFYISADAQVYPYNFTPVTTPTDSMFVPYQIKSGSSFLNRKIYFTDMKDYFGINVQTTLITYTPSATGNTLNLGQIVEHSTTGEIWAIDLAGDAKKLNDPTETMKSFTVSQDSILIFYDQNGDEIDRDTVPIASYGGGSSVDSTIYATKYQVDTAKANLRTEIAAGGGGGGSGDISNGGNSGAVVIGSNDNTLGLESNGTTAIHIDANQKVGFNEASPSANLDIVGGTDNAALIEATKIYTNTSVGNQNAFIKAVTFRPASTSSTEFISNNVSLTMDGTAAMNGGVRNFVANYSNTGSGDIAKAVTGQFDMSFSGAADTPETLNLLGNTTFSGSGRSVLSDGFKATASGAIDWYRGIVVGTQQNGTNSETPKKVMAFYADDLAADSVAYFLYQGGANDLNYLEGNLGIKTSNPLHPLHVDGNIFGTGNLTLNATSVISGSNTNIGINQTTPVGQLEVFQDDIGNSGQPVYLASASSTETNVISNKGHLRINNTSGTDNTFGAIDFASNISGNAAGRIGVQFIDAANDYGELFFYTRGASGYSEKLRLTDTQVQMEGSDFATSGGNLSITTNDALAADKGGSIVLRGVHRSDGQKSDFAKIKAGKVNATHGNTLSYLSFYTNPNGALTERMRIDSDGNVGINTTSPSTELEVNGTIKATATDIPDTVYLSFTPLGFGTQLVGTGDLDNDGITISSDLADYTLSQIYYNVATAGTGGGAIDVRLVIDDLARTTRTNVGQVSYSAGEVEKQSNPAQSLSQGDLIRANRVSDTLAGPPEGLTITVMLTK